MASRVSSLPEEAKGIGNSTTLPKDVTDRREAFHCLLSLSDSVAGRLRKARMSAGMVSVESKYSSFQTASHQMPLSLFDLPGQEIPLSEKLSPATDAPNAEKPDLPGAAPSPSLEKLAALDKTLDSIRRKYGENAVVRGSFLKEN